MASKESTVSEFGDDGIDRSDCPTIDGRIALDIRDVARAALTRGEGHENALRWILSMCESAMGSDYNLIQGRSLADAWKVARAREALHHIRAQLVEISLAVDAREADAGDRVSFALSEIDEISADALEEMV